MAKRKTSKKTSKKITKTSRVSRVVRKVIAKAREKTRGKARKGPSKKSQLRSRLKDEVLLKLGPSVQAQLKKMSEKVESGNWGMDDVKRLGLQILQKAQEVTEALKKKKKVSKKKVGRR